MKVQVIGKKSGSFMDKDTGEMITFGKLHCVGKFSLDDSGCEGDQCLIVSCKPAVLKNIPVPCRADLEFNQFGRLAGLEILDDEE